MHASTQERFKHSIPPQSAIDVFRPPYPRKRLESTESVVTAQDETEVTSKCRINITFRFYRPDFVPTTTPRCKCGHPCVLRPDMKGRSDRPTESQPSGGKWPKRDDQIRYWWTCYAGAQDNGKGCGMWRVMDMTAEGRGPCIGREETQAE